MKTTRTKITIHTERLLVMTGSRNSYGRCAACGDEVHMLTVDQAAALSQVDSLTVYRWIERGMIHCAETEAGVELICATSLAERNFEDSASAK